MPQKPRADKGANCPLWRKDMSTVCHKCAWWIHVRGKHPQTSEEVDGWGCSIAWLPILMIENSQMQRQTGAAVETLRNEISKGSKDAAKAFVSLLEPMNDVRRLR